MEKFRIAIYGMMQVTAIVYGILLSGAGVKACNTTFGPEIISYGVMPAGYYRAILFREYGLWLLVGVITWTIAVTYFSSPYSPWSFDSDRLALSGLVLAIALAIMSAFFALGSLVPFLYVTTGMSS
jgi:hypothetical protein